MGGWMGEWLDGWMAVGKPPTRCAVFPISLSVCIPDWSGHCSTFFSHREAAEVHKRALASSHKMRMRTSLTCR